MNDGLDTGTALASLDEKPSRQYRSSPYTVREYSALSYCSRLSVDLTCDEQEGITYTRYTDETSEKPYTVGVATRKVKSAQPAQLPSTTSQPSSPMTTATAYVHPAPSPALHTLNTPELIDHDAAHPDNEHTSAVPVGQQEPDAELRSAPATAPTEVSPKIGTTEVSPAMPYDIVAVAGHYVNLTASNDDTDWTHWGYSPFCGGTTHSFAVNEATGQYKCFTSLRSGEAVDLVMFMEEISQEEAVKWLTTSFPAEYVAEVVHETGPLPTPALFDSLAGQVAATTAPVAPAAPVVVEDVTYSTTNYDLFHSLPINRPVKQSDVRILIAQISERNLLRTQPMNVTAEMGIIDGQHRLAAARELGVPIYYKIGEELDEADIIALNVARKNWQGTDYLHFYTRKGRPDYIALTEFMKRHPMLSFSNAKMMLGESKKGNIDEFRKGQWKLGSTEKAEEVAGFIKRIAADVPSFKQPTHTGFVAAVYHCATNINGFDTNEFLNKILKNPRMLVICASLKQFVEMFEEIYNFRTNAGNRLSF